MVKLVQYKRNMKIPEVDYVLDKQEDLKDILSVITPKFSGVWEIIVIDAKLKFVKDFISEEYSSDWWNVYFYLPRQKLNEVVLDFPKFQPKEKTNKDLFDELIATMHHLIDEPARKALYRALGSNYEELKDVVEKLDKECTGVSVSLKDVQSNVMYTKRVYASDVVNAFLLKSGNRWSLFDKLVKELGLEYAYRAMYKYVRNLLISKNDYLQNKDVKNRIVSKVDAPLICYTYVVFANSTNYKQLYGLLLDIDNRGEKPIERILQC